MNNSIYNFLDWTKGDDAQIAAALGVTRQAVAAARKVRRITPISNHGGKRIPGKGKKLGRPAGSKPKQAKDDSEPANVSDQIPAALDSANTTDSSSRLSASVLFVLGLSWWFLL